MTPYSQIRRRSEFLGTSVINRVTGKRLGVVSQVWFDIDRCKVVAVSLRRRLLPGLMLGTERIVLLHSFRQVSDIILVDDDDAIADDFNLSSYSTMLNFEVTAESAKTLGWLRDLTFDVMTGKLESIVTDSFGLSTIPVRLTSTYELPSDEIVSTGHSRIIVFEGAEDRLAQLSVGILDRLGIGRTPWERDDQRASILIISKPNDWLQ
ncbi:MAG: PRC-barrel domain-containing protein [Cyanobacteria bacterium P01_F01_bin.56]